MLRLGIGRLDPPKSPKTYSVLKIAALIKADLEKAGFTSDDYRPVLSRDPLSDGASPESSSRFVRLGIQFPYAPACPPMFAGSAYLQFVLNSEPSGRRHSYNSRPLPYSPRCYSMPSLFTQDSFLAQFASIA
jgi:hypothetical protein